MSRQRSALFAFASMTKAAAVIVVLATTVGCWGERRFDFGVGE
jgi:hypothetical protein